MSLKLKAVGFAVLAAVSIGAFAVVNASATVNGHFVSSVSHTIVDQRSSSESKHSFVMKIDGGNPIECNETRAFGTIASSTVQQVEGTTELNGCHTQGEPAGSLVIDTNGCKGQGTSNAGGNTTGHLICPAGKTVVVTHPSCTINIPSQTVLGFTTTQTTVNGKHAITLDVNVNYTAHYESGICVFLGTVKTASIVGSTVIRGETTLGEIVSITST